MKKILFGAMFIAMSTSLYAQEVNTQPSLLSSNGNGNEQVTTFYGSKASSNANNPCKGATIRKCGTISTKMFSDDVAMVETTWLDENGNVAKQEMCVKEAEDLKLDFDDVLPEIND
ncbi:hypothetical protein E5358_00525 [Palleniella muris]|uniref:Uncharacterized protein n=1 Tax=Palleniella muris TaxID=3038145 RepID=A0AC61QU72_9BACT|nr:hypothetical protein [Palleniella muris]TGX84156.1 hypothetical protein E5358_00525 [Palleniella muris]